MKPKNPYRKGTIVWSLFEGDWSDLTAAQIADVLDTTRDCIHAALCRIKRETGYTVPHMTERKPAGGKTGVGVLAGEEAGA